MKIAICGTASSSNLKAPYDDLTWTIWTLGKNWELNKRYDKFFEMHRIEELRNIGAAQRYFDFLKVPGDKLVLCEPRPDYPDAKVYPQKEVMEYFGAINSLMGKYFTSTIAWQVAWAIMLGAEEIGVWGVDLVMDEEYAFQRCCLEMFFGFAIGRGIKITLPDETPLMRSSYLYGFQDDPAIIKALQARIKGAEADHAKHTNTMKEAGGWVNYKQGEIDTLRSIERLLH